MKRFIAQLTNFLETAKKKKIPDSLVKEASTLILNTSTRSCFIKNNHWYDATSLS